MEEESLQRNLLKYFLHGITFSILVIGLAIFWVFIFAFLVSIGLFIGFIIGFLVLFYLIAGINVYLTGRIWDVSVKEDLLSLLGHGFTLFVALIIGHIPAIVISLFVQSQIVTIAFVIINAFIDGFLAVNVASMWEEEYEG